MNQELTNETSVDMTKPHELLDARFIQIAAQRIVADENVAELVRIEVTEYTQESMRAVFALTKADAKAKAFSYQNERQDLELRKSVLEKQLASLEAFSVSTEPPLNTAFAKKQSIMLYVISAICLTIILGIDVVMLPTLLLAAGIGDGGPTIYLIGFLVAACGLLFALPVMRGSVEADLIKSTKMSALMLFLHLGAIITLNVRMDALELKLLLIELSPTLEIQTMLVSQVFGITLTAIIALTMVILVKHAAMVVAALLNRDWIEKTQSEATANKAFFTIRQSIDDVQQLLHTNAINFDTELARLNRIDHLTAAVLSAAHNELQSRVAKIRHQRQAASSQLADIHQQLQPLKRPMLKVVG
jgi:hypothetical protein